MSKKILSVVLCFVIVATLCFSGCTKEQQNEQVVLEWMVPIENQQDLPLVMEEVNKIVMDELGFKINIVPISPGAYNEKMRMLMASKDDFDIMFTGYVNNYRTAVENGSLEPLSELIKEYGKDIYGQIDITCFDDSEVDGEIYAVPNYQIAYRQNCLFLHKGMVEKYGFDVSTVKSTKDIEPFLKLIKENEPNMFPYRTNWGIGNFYNDKYEQIVGNICIDTTQENPKAINIMDTPEYKEAVETTRDWYEKGYIRVDVASVTDDNVDFKNAKYGVYTALHKPGAEVQSKLQTGGVEYIPIKVGNPYMRCGTVQTAMTGINVFSKHKVEAMKAINLVHTNKEIMDLLSYGIEGKHYTRDENGCVVLIPESTYNVNGNAWIFGNQFNTSVMSGQPLDVYEQTLEENKNSVKSPILGFVFDKTATSVEIANISAIIGEYNCLNNGSRALGDYFDEYKIKLNEAGEEKVLEEVNRQLEEFYKSKND